jgi:hypothetical protein
MKRLILYLFALLPIVTLTGNAQIVGSVALEYDPATLFTVEAGTTLQFELVARDTVRSIIGTWDAVGYNAVLAVRGTDAETDSSTRSWSADPLGYSWLELRLSGTVLTIDSVGLDQGLYYTLPHSAFTFGKAALDFTLTCAGKDITFSITPALGTLVQKSPPITIIPAPHENYLVELTRPLTGEDKVFLLRRYEIVVAPRDRYLNVISGRDIATAFRAAFPGEFNPQPTSDILLYPVFVNGVKNYFLTSNLRRLDSQGDARQILIAQKKTGTLIRGQTDPFEVIEHPPNAFALLMPPEYSFYFLGNASERETFTWIKALPQDPYTDIRTSRFKPFTCTDIVKYDVTFVDSLNPTRSVSYPADNFGLDASLTLTHGDLYDICHVLAAGAIDGEMTLAWYVTARDYDGCLTPEGEPLHATVSSPPKLDAEHRPGFRIVVDPRLMHTELGERPHHFALRQNFPNPFSPATSIPVDLPYPAWCRLVVYNLLGEEIELLHDGWLDSGRHSFQFNAAGLPPGLYTYRVFINGEAQARSMLLLR